MYMLRNRNGLLGPRKSPDCLLALTLKMVAGCGLGTRLGLANIVISSHLARDV